MKLLLLLIKFSYESNISNNEKPIILSNIKLKSDYFYDNIEIYNCIENNSLNRNISKNNPFTDNSLNNSLLNSLINENQLNNTVNNNPFLISQEKTSLDNDSIKNYITKWIDELNFEISPIHNICTYFSDPYKPHILYLFVESKLENLNLVNETNPTTSFQLNSQSLFESNTEFFNQNSPSTSQNPQTSNCSLPSSNQITTSQTPYSPYHQYTSYQPTTNNNQLITNNQPTSQNHITKITPFTCNLKKDTTKHFIKSNIYDTTSNNNQIYDITFDISKYPTKLY